MTAEPWVSVEEVAKHLGVAKDSIYRWIEGKGLPARRVGRLWKFKLSEVDAWVRAGGAEIGPGSRDDDAERRGSRNA
ncbi:MAG: helix-turn-helix domain-containing protein [Deltaproteobacteria bacterium]|nr:helix-turn-helix domain-containing protein [Deltaproteobacteria bacterium]